MHSRHTIPVLFALLAHLALPAVASAGPIDVSYHTTWNVYRHPEAHDPGPIDVTLDAGGNVSWLAPGGTVALGAVRFGPTPGPQWNDTYTAFTPFEVRVSVTDQTTGESADLGLPGAGVDRWDYRAWDGLWRHSYHRIELGDWFSGNAAETSAVIGHVRYTLAGRPEDDHQTAVYTLTATATNPEPGTLLLAALGLAPLALRAVRRKKN